MISDDDLAAARKHEVIGDGGVYRMRCVECDEAYPCLTRRLLDEVEALRSDNEFLRDAADVYRARHVDDGTRLSLEEVRSPEVTEPST